MKIGIDVDGTLTNWHKFKIRSAKRYIKKNNLPFRLINSNEYDLKDIFNWHREIKEKFWKENGEKIVAKVPIKRGALNAIKRIRAMGHKIFIISNRNNNDFFDPLNVTLMWLNKYKVPYDKVCVGNKYRDCIDNKIDVFIDDLPSELEKLSQIGIRTILINENYNRMATGEFKRVKLWRSIPIIIKAIQIF